MMKKTKSSKHTSTAKDRGTSTTKSKAAPETVEEYLARVPKPARSMLTKMRVTIRSVVPAQASEVISYGIPAFKHNEVLVWYAAFSRHCSLFPTKSVLEALKDELKGFSISKGTIQFPLDKPLPTLLVKKLVKARVSQIGTKE